MAVIGWNSTSKKTVMDARELPAIRRKAVPAGTGYLFYNSHRDSWEKPRDIQFIQSKRRKLAGA